MPLYPAAFLPWRLLDDWWNRLDLSLQIFYAIGILSLFLLLIQMAMSLLFGTDHDAGDGHDGDGIVSVRTVSAFFFAFGWTGVICVKAGLAPGIAAVVAVIPGMILAAMLILLMRAMHGLASDGTFQIESVVGHTATVYLTIPGAMDGAGEIQVQGGGRVSNLKAYTRGGVLSSGTDVRISGMHGDGAVLVEKL